MATAHEPLWLRGSLKHSGRRCHLESPLRDWGMAGTTPVVSVALRHVRNRGSNHDGAHHCIAGAVRSSIRVT